ncbi:hypothetical protein, partial [Novosphingobium lentum]|uniref:hypothetical protein n=1 Tax=Novosphingobium lentum TaxID=145287 RepID=UPI000A7EBAF2
LALPGAADLTLSRAGPGAAVGAFLRFSDADGREFLAALHDEHNAIAAECFTNGLPVLIVAYLPKRKDKARPA